MTAKDDKIFISMLDIKDLKDNELTEQLKKHGYSPGPILPSTRRAYEKKLLELLTAICPTKCEEKTSGRICQQESGEKIIALKRNSEMLSRITEEIQNDKLENHEDDDDQICTPLPLQCQQMTHEETPPYSMDDDIDIYCPTASPHPGISFPLFNHGKEVITV
ncbi:LEM domain-containing protein 1 isoform X2 [Monodelphis domestica]|uniref:LEM domain-containing protein 1 isoform X2 n=1 Tax=Monodelphis domestica TaxID=13616 RepID=UPI0007B40B31|nr:LEM domain-containing protein 1 isoform X2 [Monodelphis domestica]